MIKLFSNAQVVVTMDAERREIENGAVLINSNVIQYVDDQKSVDAWLAANNVKPDETIDLSGCVLLPGLVNCHHHLYQTLTRSIGTSEGLSLFDWLKTLYPIWAELDSEAVYVSAKVGLIELLLSGATTVADHLYLYPNDAKIDDEIRAAQGTRCSLPPHSRQYEPG